MAHGYYRLNSEKLGLKFDPMDRQQRHFVMSFFVLGTKLRYEAVFPMLIQIIHAISYGYILIFITVFFPLCKCTTNTFVSPMYHHIV